MIVVTGGGRGIGRVYCERMAEAGARMVVADIDAEANDDTVAAIRAAGGEAVACATDVSQADQAERMAQTAIDGFGADRRAAEQRLADERAPARRLDGNRRPSAGTA